MASTAFRAPRARAGTSGPPRKPQRSRSLFGPGLRVGSVSGIEVNVDYSVLIIAALIVFNLGRSVFPAWHPNWSATLTWAMAICSAFLFFVSVLLHEFSHAFVGRRFGIPITGITLFIFGGMAHMQREPDRPKSEFLMAAVGPVTSIAIGVFATVGGLWLGRGAFQGAAVDGAVDAATLQRLGPAATLLLWIGPLNIALGIFNLVPGFPLDGGRVLRSLLWWLLGDFRRATQWAAFVGQLIAWTLLAAGAFMIFGFSVPVLGKGFGQGIWLVLIGWFLNNAAKLSYENALIRQSLDDAKVSTLMRSGVVSLNAESTIAELGNGQLIQVKQLAFPVVKDGALVGLVVLDAINQVPEAEAERTTVAEIMTPLDPSAVVSADSDASDALRALAERDLEELPVQRDGLLVGMIRRQDIIAWLRVELGSKQSVGEK